MRPSVRAIQRRLRGIAVICVVLLGKNGDQVASGGTIGRVQGLDEDGGGDCGLSMYQQDLQLLVPLEVSQLYLPIGFDAAGIGRLYGLPIWAWPEQQGGVSGARLFAQNVGKESAAGEQRKCETSRYIAPTHESLLSRFFLWQGDGHLRLHLPACTSGQEVNGHANQAPGQNIANNARPPANVALNLA